jgi:hypothetical protein
LAPPDFFTEDALLATARTVLFPTAPEAPAFATFFPGAGGREVGRCAVFLRIGFLSAAIQICPGGCVETPVLTTLFDRARTKFTQPKLWEFAS